MKINGVGKLRVNIMSHGCCRSDVKRYVKTNGIITGEQLAAEMALDNETLMHVVDEIVRIVKAGYEVRLGHTEEDCVRFYPLLDKECKKMLLIAQTIGGMRESVSKLKFSVYRKGMEIDEEETEQEISQAKRKHELHQVVSVTPDTMVTCPKCGTKFRVGRALTKSE